MVAQISQTLETLARETDPKARSLLIRKLTAEYVRRINHTPTEMERVLFSSLVLDLYDHIDVAVRRDIITLLAHTTDITEGLATRLAEEGDDIVTPLYEHSPLLDGNILLRSVRARNEAVLKAIARRREVSPKLVDALLARAFASVLVELLDNMGAQFSRQALTFCAIAGRSSDDLLALIAARCLKDLSFHQRMIKRMEDGCPFIPGPFVRASKEGTLEELASSGTLGHDHAGPIKREEALLQINLGELTFDTLLATLLEAESKDDILWFLKDEPGLSTKAMEHLLTTEGNLSLTRILTEQGVSLKTFEALMSWRVEEFKFPQRNVYREIEQYRQSLRMKRSA